MARCPFRYCYNPPEDCPRCEEVAQSHADQIEELGPPQGWGE